MLSKPSLPWTLIASRAPSRKPRSAVTSRTGVPSSAPRSTRSCPPAAVTSSASTARAVGRRRPRVERDPRLRAVGLQRELLGLGGADGAQRVLAGAAVERVEALALQRGVVAVAEQDAVVAAARLDEVGVVAGGDRLRRPGRRSRCRRPRPDSIVTASVSASAIRIVSAPAPERISIVRERRAVEVDAVDVDAWWGRSARSVMLSAAPSPVTDSVPALTEGMTAASAAAGSATVRTAASRRIRRMAASCGPPARPTMRGFPGPA